MVRTRRNLAVSLSIAAIAAVTACSKAESPPADASATAAPASMVSAEDVMAVKALNSAWFAHYNAHHADSLASLYADDAVLMLPGSPMIRGRDAIQAAYKKDMDESAKAGYINVQGKQSEISVSGDIGYESNVFTVTDKAGKQLETGKYVTVFGRKNGKWMIVRDIWNMDSAPKS